ncbi:DUF2933 domain-containing protein [Robertmurraya sp. GLU-23]
MEWLSYLLVLLCPLMMIFCMKGHGNHKKHDNHFNSDISSKLTNLEKENEELKREIDLLSSLVKKES